MKPQIKKIMALHTLIIWDKEVPQVVGTQDPARCTQLNLSRMFMATSEQGCEIGEFKIIENHNENIRICQAFDTNTM